MAEFFRNASGANVRNAVMNAVAGNQINIYRDREPGLYELLAPVDDAGYSRNDRSGPVPRCHPGTREDVMSEIDRWVEHDKTRICWLNGPAGSGKSAISQTIAEMYASKKRLAASFFFFRGAGSRSAFDRFIPTLSYQLSLSVSSTKPLIERVLRNERSVTSHQSLSHQFQRLFLEPLIAAKNPVINFMSKPIVIVIDALDECNDKNLIAEFIETLIGVFQRNSRLHLRFVVTSRVEEHLRKKLETDGARSVTHHLSLHEFHARVDIHNFFRSNFAIIYEENRRFMRDIAQPWPSASDLHALVEKCDGSFIFAVTIIKFINDGNGFPHEKVQMALGVEGGLDPLYAQVLSTAPRNDNFGRVIATIMLLDSPLRITSLAHLLQLKTTDILQALLGIQSILMIPGNDNEPIRPFHTSLRDYLCLQPRSLGFFIDPPTRHLSIAKDCLATIGEKPEDGIFYFTEAQQYACLQWWHHLELGLKEAEIGPDVFTSLMSYVVKFESGSLNFWVNTVIWKGNLEKILVVLSSLKELPNCPQNLGVVLDKILQHAQADLNHWNNNWNWHHDRRHYDTTHWRHMIEDWRVFQLREQLRK